MDFDEDVHVRGKIRQTITGNTDTVTGVIGGWRQVTNDGTGVRESGNGGYRSDYTTRADHCRFDVGHVFISRSESVTANGHYEGEWHVAVSPADPGGAWSCMTAEVNIGSRVDSGYQETINGPRMTGGILLVPTVPAAFGPPGSSKNATFAYAIAGGPNVDYMAQFYNGLIINPNSIARGGKGIQANGADLIENSPAAVIDVTRKWETAIKLERGTYKDNKAITLGSNHSICWADGTEAVHLTRRQITKLKRMLE